MTTPKVYTLGDKRTEWKTTLGVEHTALTDLVTNVATQEEVNDVIINNPEQVMQFKNGKEKVIGFLVGQVMKESKGKANPQNVNQILRSKLNSS